MFKKIKTWFSGAWKWVKTKTRQILIGIGIIGIATAATVLAPTQPNKITEQVMVQEFNKADQSIKGKYSLEKASLKQIAKDNPKDRIVVKIGDENGTEFVPKMKIERWDDEVNFSIQLINNDTDKPDFKTENGKIKWIKNKREVNFYDITTSTEHPEGAYEFEVILKEKSKTNKIEFSLNTKGVDFFYQPPLTEEFQNGYSEEFKKEIVVTETQVKDLQGNVLVNRPENVVGSYAVYASENKINYVGGKKYKVGKVGHIFRPKIIDSVGTEVWGDLHIENGILSATIPQDFLDKAIYPVRHAAGLTFGYTTIGGGNLVRISTNGDRAIVKSTLLHTGVTGDIITLISAYSSRINGSSNNGTVDVAIYTFAGGVPVTRLATAVTITASNPFDVTDLQWNNTSALNQSLTNGTVYAVGFGNFGGTDGINIRFDTISNGDCSYQAAGALPATWSQTGTDNYVFSIYATYTAAATGETPNYLIQFE